MEDKKYALKQLKSSKTFILVTDEETMMYVDFDAIEASIQLIALKEVHRNLGRSIKKIQEGLDNARN